MDWKKIDARISRNSLLKHPFYQAWTAGELTIEDLKVYAAQYYTLEKNFPRLLSRLHASTADPSIRQGILENLIDEERGKDNHRELWLRFAEGLGLRRAEAEKAEVNPKTARALAELNELCADPDIGVGLSALYAYESQQPKVSASKIDGLRRHYGIADKRSLRFFEVHKEIDVWHSEEGRWMIEASGTETPKIHAAVSRSCRVLLGFLDGVDERTRLPRIARGAHETREAREAVPAGC